MNPELDYDIQKYNPYWYPSIRNFLDGNPVSEPNEENGGIDFEVDISQYDTCVVGEIHGQSSAYASEISGFYCKRCTELGDILSKAFNEENRDLFEDALTGLYRHIKQVKHKFEDEDDY
jgi:hypothetical protein